MAGRRADDARQAARRDRRDRRPRSRRRIAHRVVRGSRLADHPAPPRAAHRSQPSAPGAPSAPRSCRAWRRVLRLARGACPRVAADAPCRGADVPRSGRWSRDRPACGRGLVSAVAPVRPSAPHRHHPPWSTRPTSLRRPAGEGAGGSGRRQRIDATRPNGGSLITIRWHSYSSRLALHSRPGDRANTEGLARGVRWTGRSARAGEQVESSSMTPRDVGRGGDRTEASLLHRCRGVEFPPERGRDRSAPEGAFREGTASRVKILSADLFLRHACRDIF